MAKLAVLASGNGSNFQALADAIIADGRHSVVLLACDKAEAYALERAKNLGVPTVLVSYKGRPRPEAEAQLHDALTAAGADIVALAGFMRILSANFVHQWAGRLVNVHPSILPAWPGAHAIERAYEAGEPELGVTVHYVDAGMDTGPIIGQVRVPRGQTLDDTEALIHKAEHSLYPRLVLELLNRV
ncbi:MAG TPA: phosphoribosylglycinamide formyltransferase [Spirochaetales bacterium]|nr:phosphoribosylglycinamide formyltransferase [Spirochaetales bacterium]